MLHFYLDNKKKKKKKKKKKNHVLSIEKLEMKTLRNLKM